MAESGMKKTFADVYEHSSERKVITNIYELIACSETDEALCFCDSDEKYRRRETSDFEYFSELLRVLPELRGTRVYENICTVLCEFCGIENVEYELTKTDASSLWICANEKIFEFCNGEYAELLKKYGAEKLYFTEFAFIENSCVGKCYIDEKESVFVYDMRALDFVRPDPYHYECAIKKQNNGGKLNNQEISVILLQKLYLKLTKKQRGKIQLHLRTDQDGRSAEEIINYFKGRRLPLDIYVAFEGEQSVEKIVSLCLLSDECVRVRPEIVLTRTDSFLNLCERMKLLFAAYPYKRTAYGGSVTDSSAFFLGYKLYESAITHIFG